jgi:hypothetical protein
MLTVETAEDSDIWPDPSSRPAPALRKQIRKVAAKISAQEVADAGLKFEPWFARFYLAQGRVEREAAAQQRARQEAGAATERAARAEQAEVADAWTQWSADVIHRLAVLERSVLGEGGEPGVLGKTLIDLMVEAERELEKKIEALSQKIETIERTRLRFLGVHEPGRGYSLGNLVVRNGSLWHCNCDTNETPGRSTAWQLALKNGEANRGVEK